MGKFAKVGATLDGYQPSACPTRRANERGIVAVEMKRRPVADSKPGLSAAVADNAYVVWQAEDRRCQIEFKPETLEAIRFECSRCANGVGGMAIGGVLLGQHMIKGIRILDWRPISCEHSHGPDFLLSEHDHDALTSLLDGLRDDPSPEALSVVGWFVSDPRGGFEFGAEELELQCRRFEESNLVLMIQANRLGDADLAVYNGDGVRIDPVLHFDPRPKRVRGSSSCSPNAFPAALIPKQTSGAWTSVLWTIPALATFILVGSALLAHTQRPQSAAKIQQSPIEMLSLHATLSNGELAISWNGLAEPIRHASKASLLIRDGVHFVNRDLDQAAMRLGVQIYKPQSEKVIVILQGESPGGQRFEEATTTYLHPVLHDTRQVTALTPDMLPPPGE